MHVLKNTWSVVTLKTGSVKALAKTPKVKGFGYLTVLISTVAMAIGGLNPLVILAYPFQLIGLWIFVLLAHFSASTLFKGKGDLQNFWGISSNLQMIYWVTVIPIVGPFISWIVGIYGLVLSGFAIRDHYGLTTGKAILALIIAILIPAIVFGILAAIFAAIFGAALWGALMSGY